MKDQAYWIAMLKVSGEHYVLSSKNEIEDFGTKEAALNFFTNAYNKSQSRGYQTDTSALITSMLSSPKIIEADSDTLTKQLFNEQTGINSVKFGGIFRNLQGLKCNRSHKSIEQVYNSGITPKGCEIK